MSFFVQVKFALFGWCVVYMKSFLNLIPQYHKERVGSFYYLEIKMRENDRQGVSLRRDITTTYNAKLFHVHVVKLASCDANWTLSADKY